jgi:hypothetical protein
MLTFRKEMKKSSTVGQRTNPTIRINEVPNHGSACRVDLLAETLPLKKIPHSRKDVKREGGQGPQNSQVLASSLQLVMYFVSYEMSRYGVALAASHFF